MATITRTQARFLGNAWGLPDITRGGAEQANYKETASQSYDAGQPLYKDSNGTIALAVASSNLVPQMCGFALEDATGTTGEKVRYRVLKPGDRLLCNVSGLSTNTNPLTLIGTLVNFDIFTGNLLVVNPDSAVDTNVAAIVEDIYTVAGGYADGDAAGDTYGRVIVRIIDNKALQG